MKKIIIAFDVDGTLIKNEPYGECNYIPNNRIVHLLEILSTFKNVKILVWSGSGVEHCKKAISELGIKKFIWKIADKNHKGKDENGKHIFEPGFKPDIAIDDIQGCELGLINLIVKEK